MNYLTQLFLNGVVNSLHWWGHYRTQRHATDRDRIFERQAEHTCIFRLRLSRRSGLDDVYDLLCTACCRRTNRMVVKTTTVCKYSHYSLRCLDDKTQYLVSTPTKYDKFGLVLIAWYNNAPTTFWYGSLLAYAHCLFVISLTSFFVFPLHWCDVLFFRLEFKYHSNILTMSFA